MAQVTAVRQSWMLQCSCFISHNAHTLANYVKSMGQLALLSLCSVDMNAHSYVHTDEPVEQR